MLTLSWPEVSSNSYFKQPTAKQILPLNKSALRLYHINKQHTCMPAHSWEAIGHIPSGRDGSAAVSTVDNRIIVIGGWNDRNGVTNTVWIGSCEPQ